MTPEALEKIIQARSADVLVYQSEADRETNPNARESWRKAARRAAADVADLVAMRSLETVKRMEAERGLL